MSVDTPIIAEPPTYPPDPTPPVTLVLTILLLVMFFVGFFSIYFCRCFMDNLVNSLNNRQIPNGAPVNPAPMPLGLDSETVEKIPTAVFGSLKDYHPEMYNLECAICLSEYIDSDIIRVLPICDHVFHIQCIDLWFESHKSCPVCRRHPGLENGEKSPEKASRENALESINNEPINNNNEGETVDDTIIDIRENTQDYSHESNTRGDGVLDIGDNRQDYRGIKHGKTRGSGEIMAILVHKHHGNEESSSNAPYLNEKFSRSHSTGHSIFKRNLDKYTLKLPKHVKENITRKHMAALSCITFEEFSRKDMKRNDGFGELEDIYCLGEDGQRTQIKM